MASQPSSVSEVIDRFMQKFSVDSNGCWVWTEGRYSSGYGEFWNGERNMVAHQFAYELFVGPIPDGLEPDHTCRQRACVNPEHLDPVTRRENIARGESHIARQMEQEVCHRGHELSGANLYVHRGHRHCRACRRDRMNRYYAEGRTYTKKVNGTSGVRA